MTTACTTGVVHAHISCDASAQQLLCDRRTHFDFVVCVTAPVPVRLKRIMLRDHISEQKAQEWIEAVMPQEELAARADFEIVNDGIRDVEEQVMQLLKRLA